MKTTLTTTLLLFLELATSAPIPSSASASFPRRCAYMPCHPSLARLLSSGARPNTPPTKLTAPHHWNNPTSQDIGGKEPFNNSPYAPSSDVSSAVALSSKRPLKSEYLRKLSNFAATQHTFRLQEKDEATEARAYAFRPTSALPELRKADLEPYWANEDKNRQGIGLSKHTPAIGNILLPGEIYIKSRNLSQTNDILVVVVVLIFLALVIAVEGAEKLVELKNYLTKPKESVPIRHRQIYLEYSEPTKAPLSIQAHASQTPYAVDEEKESVDS